LKTPILDAPEVCWFISVKSLDKESKKKEYKVFNKCFYNAAFSDRLRLEFVLGVE